MSEVDIAMAHEALEENKILATDNENLRAQLRALEQRQAWQAEPLPGNWTPQSLLEAIVQEGEETLSGKRPWQNFVVRAQHWANYLKTQFPPLPAPPALKTEACESCKGTGYGAIVYENDAAVVGKTIPFPKCPTCKGTGQKPEGEVMPLALDLCCGLGGGGKGLKAAGFSVIGVDIEAWPNEHNDHFIQADLLTLSGHEITAKYGKISFVWASPPCQEFSYSSFPFKKAREKFTKDKPPDRRLWDACLRIAKECECPIVLENVRGAVKWMGPAVAHYGSFYLWGDVPAMLPIGRPQKGFGRVKELKNPSDPFGGFGGSSYQSKGGKGPLNKKRADAFGWNDPNVQNARKKGFPGEVERGVYSGGGQEKSKQVEGSRYKKMVGSEKYRQIHGAEQAGHAGTNARKLWSAQAAMIPIELSTWIGQCFLPQQRPTPGESVGEKEGQ